MTDETSQAIVISVAVVCVVGMIFGGVTTYSVLNGRQLAELTKSVCDADLNKDLARAFACNELARKNIP